jgi:A/G-specific adenine glycosylase
VCADRFGCKVVQIERLAPFDHVFTHFRLHIQPLLCHVGKQSLSARSGAANGSLWLTLEDAHRAAVPTPVRKLLTQLVK